MKLRSGLCTLFVFTLVSPLAAQSSGVLKQERQEMEAVYKEAWDADLVWKLDELPTKGGVYASRVPYAGAIYPDRGGGTVDVCRKYDMAFHGGRMLAASYEARDTKAHKAPSERRGFFGFGGRRMRVPYWSGHCNGWATASIRHAEPTKNVKQNGVVFTPSDIKALLAEVYTFSDTAMLGGAYEHVINPASLHVTLTNWIGRKYHPVTMESTPGKEIWNFPVYAYRMKVKKHGSYADVETMIWYKHYLDFEQDKAPKSIRTMNFYYRLRLDKDGKIVGGNYNGYGDRIDFLWVSRVPTQGGTRGNEMGNPHLKLKNVLALWKASVDEKAMDKWVNVELALPPVEKPNNEAVATVGVSEATE